MSESLIDLWETIADLMIIGICAWVAWLFWMTFARMKSGRNMAMAAAFALVAGFKLFQVTADKFLDIRFFVWMDSVLAAEALIIFLGVSVIVALSGPRHGRWAQKTEDQKARRRRAA